jgi:hypothetical protein
MITDFITSFLDLLGIPPTPTSSSVSKKNSSRRNAWGNLSYADLITKAISSASDNRLTLSQIYEWMVQNVPYFKDKGDSNSSAGWKVSFSIDQLISKISKHLSSHRHINANVQEWVKFS